MARTVAEIEKIAKESGLPLYIANKKKSKNVQDVSDLLKSIDLYKASNTNSYGNWMEDVGGYDDYDPEDSQRKIQGIMPKSAQKTYDVNDWEDNLRLKLNLPSKTIESNITYDKYANETLKEKIDRYFKSNPNKFTEYDELFPDDPVTANEKLAKELKDNIEQPSYKTAKYKSASDSEYLNAVNEYRQAQAKAQEEQNAAKEEADRQTRETKANAVLEWEFGQDGLYSQAYALNPGMKEAEKKNLIEQPDYLEKQYQIMTQDLDKKGVKLPENEQDKLIAIKELQNQVFETPEEAQKRIEADPEYQSNLSNINAKYDEMLGNVQGGTSKSDLGRWEQERQKVENQRSEEIRKLNEQFGIGKQGQVYDEQGNVIPRETRVAEYFNNPDNKKYLAEQLSLNLRRASQLPQENVEQTIANILAYKDYASLPNQAKFWVNQVYNWDNSQNKTDVEQVLNAVQAAVQAPIANAAVGLINAPIQFVNQIGRWTGSQDEVINTKFLQDFYAQNSIYSENMETEMPVFNAAVGILSNLVDVGFTAMIGSATGGLASAAGAGSFLTWLARSTPFMMKAGASYQQDALRKGANQDQAWWYGTIGGIVEGAIEEFSVSKIIKGFPSVGKFLTQIDPTASKAFVQQFVAPVLKVMASGSVEYLQEIATDPMMGLVEKLLFNPDKEWVGAGGIFDPQSLINNIPAFIVGGIFGAFNMAGENSQAKKLFNDLFENFTPEKFDEAMNVLIAETSMLSGVFGTPESYAEAVTSIPGQTLSETARASLYDKISSAQADLQSAQAEYSALLKQRNDLGPVALETPIDVIKQKTAITAQMNQVQRSINTLTQKVNNLTTSANYVLQSDINARYRDKTVAEMKDQQGARISVPIEEEANGLVKDSQKTFNKDNSIPDQVYEVPLNEYPEMAQEIESFYNDSLEKIKNNDNTYSSMPLIKVSQKLADDIKKGTDIDVSDAQHVLTYYGIKKILNSHGSTETEAPRGQVPANEKDFTLIPYIVDNYDTIRFAKNSYGNNLAILGKRVDGHIYYVEEMIVGKKHVQKELRPQTMYKIKATQRVDDSMNPPSNAQSVSGMPSNNIISEPAKNATLPGENVLRERQFIANTIQNSPDVPNEMKQYFKDNPEMYRPVTNADQFNNAVSRVNADYQAAMEQFNNLDVLRSGDDTALGEALILKSIQNKDMRTAQNLSASLAEKTTSAGQAIQALMIMHKYTPTGALVYGQRLVDKALQEFRAGFNGDAKIKQADAQASTAFNEMQNMTDKQKAAKLREVANVKADIKINKRYRGVIDEVNDVIERGAYTQEEITDVFYKKQGIPRLTQSDVQYVTDNLTKTTLMEDGDEKDILQQQAAKRVAEAIPGTASEKLKALQRILMLLNPKTQVRNIFGNVIYNAGMRLPADFLRAGIDKMVSLITSERTAATPDLKAFKNGFKEGFTQAIDNYKLGINSGNTKFESAERSPFRSNALKYLDDITSALLEIGDAPFNRAVFAENLSAQLKLSENNIITADMIAQAQQAADEATFKDTNSFVNAMGKIRSALNTLGIKDKSGRRFGVGDLIIPFMKTPANLVKIAFQYSPLNVANALRTAIIPGQKGFDQFKFVNKLSKGLTGTGIMMLGYALARSGVITAKREPDKDKNAINKSAGINDYSINFSALGRWLVGQDTTWKDGDFTYTYDWAQPMSFALAIGADASEAGLNKQDAITAMYSFLMTGMETVTNQSFLQGVQSLGQNIGEEGIAGGLAKTAAGSLTQIVPTVVGQAARIIDPYQREMYSSNPALYVWNQIKAKVPGLRETLPIKYDVTGKIMPNDASVFNVILNPGTTSTITLTNIQSELLRLMSTTEEKTFLPQYATRSLKGNGTTIKLEGADYAKFQRILGELTINGGSGQNEYGKIVATPGYKNIIKTDRYQRLSDAAKVKWLSAERDTAYEIAKWRMLKEAGAKYRVAK